MSKKKNCIIAFANQKGGCGKSTLCTLLANYLNSQKKDVCVIDTDSQQSLFLQRRDEQGVYGQEPYPIQGFDLSTPAIMEQLLKNARDFDGYVLIDCPGRLSDDGIIPILLQSDYIICPVQYEIKSLTSTSTFIKAFQTLQGKFGRSESKILFIPNNSKRKGSLEERKAWEAVVTMLSTIGTVLETIPYRACIERTNTYEISSAQREVVKNTFDSIIKITKK